MEQGYSPWKKGVSSPWSRFIATNLEFSGRLPGPRSAAWLERDHRVMSPSYTRVYPLVVRRAHGAMIEDMDGNRFLDFTAGIAVTNVGHSHPRVVAAIQRAEPAADPHVGDRLLLCAPGPAGRAAGRAGARDRTRSASSSPTAGPRRSRPRSSWRGGTPGRNRALAFLGAFHGRTYGAMSLSGSKPMQRRGLRAAGSGDPPRPLRRPRERARPAADGLPARRAGGDLRRADPGRRGLHRSARRVPARPAAALRRARDPAGPRRGSERDSAGRASCSPREHWGVEGDIVCLAKGIANGLPLGAIVARAAVMDWPSGSHASTFGGNPVACAASLATAAAGRDALPRQRRAPRGRSFARGLKTLGRSLSVHSRGPRARPDDRGRDPGSGGQPAPRLRDRIIDLAFHAGLLLLPCGASTVRFCPPLCLTAPPGRDRARAVRRGHGRGRSRTPAAAELDDRRGRSRTRARAGVIARASRSRAAAARV